MHTLLCTYLFSESIYILKACAAKKRAELFRFWGLDGQALASGYRPRVFHLEPPSWSFSSLYFPLGREMPVDEKWKHREKEGNTHTHTHTHRGRERKELSRNTEDKMAFIRAAVEGQRSLIFPLSLLSLHFSPPFISSVRHVVVQHFQIT